MKNIILAVTLAISSSLILAQESCVSSHYLDIDGGIVKAAKKINRPKGSTATLAMGNPGAWTDTKITNVNIARAVKALPCIIQRTMNTTGVPGVAVAVVRANEVLLARGFGLREVGRPELVDADTVFQLASLSKPVGATVISRAVSNGSASWTDPVVQYLPWFRIGDDYVTKNVTIGDLYSHRSGLPDHAGDVLEDLGFSREPILHRLAQLPSGLFRDQYSYTNFGLTAAAEAVAKANNTSWEQLSEDLLYRPAGMKATSSWYSAYLSASNRAVTHQRQAGKWVPGPPRNPQPQSPAGGVSSTANDMARWMQLYLGNGTLGGVELIKSDILQIMRQPHVISLRAKDPAARSSSYGFGIGTGADGTGHVRWSHSGAFLLGTSTYIIFIPGGDIAIVVLTNGEPHGIPESIAATFVDIVETGNELRDWLPAYAAIFERMYVNPSELAGKKRPVTPKPARPLTDYAGVYHNDYFGLATITVTNGDLVMSLGPTPYRFPLTHWDGNVFSYLPIGENALGITAVIFDPEAQTLTVENLNEHGLGKFVLQNFWDKYFSDTRKMRHHQGKHS